MGKTIVLAAVAITLIAGGATNVSAQIPDIQAKEQAYYDKVTSLRSQIAEGWTPLQVLAIMGEPDRRRTYPDGTDLVDIWGYRGYEVLIEYRNGLVSNWFFRFMQ